jgi:predicted metal-dependent hydrolase
MHASPESIVRRQVDIDFDLPPDRPWFPKGELIERMLNTVSFFFPPGEKFFIESVRDYLDRIDDPVLLEQVRRFIFQEAMHSRQHDCANSLLMHHYSRGAAVERLGRVHLAFWRRIIPKSGRLAITCAIEHFTAMGARTLLHHQVDLEPRMEPAFYRLWMWHAVEESEHKSVCFDVYRAAVGAGSMSYLLRTSIMLITTLLFFVTLIVGMKMLGRRPPLPPPSVDEPPDRRPPATPKRFYRSSLRALLADILPWRHYFAYFRPSFHPSDYDCTAYIEQWKIRFPSFGTDANTGALAPDEARES